MNVQSSVDMFDIVAFRDGRDVGSVGGQVDEWLDWALDFIDTYNPDRIEVRFYTV